jgi:hypothetical protein
MLLPHASIEQQHFEIIDRSRYNPHLRRQPTIEFNFKRIEDIEADFI